VLDREVQADYFLKAGLQSYFKLTGTRSELRYNGVVFDRSYGSLYAEFQPSGGVFAGLDITAGDGIDYENTRPGQILRVSPTLSMQVGRHLRTELRGAYERLDVDAGRVYTARLVDLRLYYQFTVQSQLRLITQYLDMQRNAARYTYPVTDSRSWASQLLFSYKVNPRTVLYAGYANGQVSERANQPLYLARQTFFLKLSYAWQL